MRSKIKEVILGDEYDNALFDKIKLVLQELSAELIDTDELVVGSQDIVLQKFKIGESLISLFSETGQGVRISGPKILIEKIEKKLNSC